jgi:hypothetical protein
MHAEYSILTDPAEVPKGFKFEPDAVLHCVRGYGNRHGRYYDVLHFVKRVWDVRGPLDITVHHLKGIPQISPRCYVRFAAVISKPAK